MRRFCFVDRISHLLPQAQWMVVVAYFGWMPSRIVPCSSRAARLVRAAMSKIGA